MDAEESQPNRQLDLDDVNLAPPSLISPGMVKRIREIFEDPLESSESSEKESTKKQEPTQNEAEKHPVLSPLRATAPTSLKRLSEPITKPGSSSPRNIRSTTVSTAKLLDLLRHYRKLCKDANSNEHALCTELLEADEPFIGMILDEPSTLGVSGDSLLQVRRQPGNDICADCGMDDNSWASTNIGVFICIRCSGVHRSLGVHVSSVLSCSLDIWSYALIESISSKGNKKINEEYEYHLNINPEHYLSLKLKPASTTEERNLFIRAKYANKEFHRKTLDPDLKEYKLRKLQLARTNIRSLSQSSLALSGPGTSELHKKAMVEYCGIVFINLQRATKILRHKKGNSLITHVYIVFTMGSQLVRSKKWKNLNKPKWNEALQLNLPMKERQLEIAANGHSAITNSTTVLGTTTIDLGEEKFVQEPQNLELPVGEGTLYLSIFVTNLSK